MGFRDVVLFLVVAVVGPRWIAVAAAVGPSAIAAWMIALLAFFVPLAFTALELAARHPEEGGIYVWTRAAFGEFAGFMTGWMYWCSNLVFFPALLYFGAGNALFIAGPAGQAWANNATYFIAASLLGLAVAFGLNVVGLDVGKRLHNAGAFGTWLPIAILIVAGAIALARFGSATPFTVESMMPTARLQDLVFWSTIAFAFAGVEAASLMGEEIRDAARVVPRAILVAGAIITAVYLLGTIAVLVALPHGEVSGLSGIMQAIDRTSRRAGLPGVTPIAALLLTVGGLGSIGAWLASTARLPFVAGVDRALPKAFGALHPKWRTPHVALAVQTAGAAAFIVLGQAGSSVKGAYDILTSMSVIIYFVPFLLMFAAMIRLQRVPAPAGAWRVPGGPPVAIALAVIGFLTTAISIVLAVMPTDAAQSPGLAVLKVGGGSLLLAAIGAGLYAASAARRRPVSPPGLAREAVGSGVSSAAAPHRPEESSP